LIIESYCIEFFSDVGLSLSQLQRNEWIFSAANKR